MTEAKTYGINEVEQHVYDVKCEIRTSVLLKLEAKIKTQKDNMTYYATGYVEKDDASYKVRYESHKKQKELLEELVEVFSASIHGFKHTRLDSEG